MRREEINRLRARAIWLRKQVFRVSRVSRVELAGLRLRIRSLENRIAVLEDPVHIGDVLRVTHPDLLAAEALVTS